VAADNEKVDGRFLPLLNSCFQCHQPARPVPSTDHYYRDAHEYSANSIGYPSESASSSKWHAWFACRCPGRRLSTWPTTAVSCPTALGALCGQLTFRLAWCREHSVVMATELLQPRDLARRTLFQSRCVIQTSPTDCYDDS